MRTSVIGFPRIGKNRELKFTSEKYFAGKISEEELLNEGRAQRSYGITKQKEAGIDLISSNDFSYYDNVLDTSFLFNAVPSRYTELGLSATDTYYAAARGYQGEKGNVKALPMKKWFNTNYHYIVPEISDDTELKLAGTKPVDEYKEAKALGVDTKVMLIGPFTFLKLARYTGSKTASDFAPSLVEAYIELINKLAQEGASWVQFDEPSLVKDLDDESIKLFESIYEKVLAKKGSVKVILQTYFGDIRDIYTKVTSMDFDAIGLDFVEGRKSLDLISKFGFPEDKILVAGLVNGKNIWRNNYSNTAEKLNIIRKAVKEDNIVLGTSCSLLHVPYTLENETKLTDEYKKHFAFAEEKLNELSEIASGDAAAFEQNAKLFTDRVNVYDKAVDERINNIKDADYTRLPAFDEREKIQKEKLKLPKFPTTTIGSFPQTEDVRRNRKDYRTGAISEEEYIKFNEDKIRECIKFQEDIGLDVLVHGEYERNDMVEYFGEHLSGYVFTEKAWVLSYGTRCVKPPIIWGDVSRKESITVRWSVFAQSCTSKPVKGMLTGPVTILNWSFPREDISLKKSTLQIALAIRDEVLDLEKNGIKIIQIDEAALREKLPLRKSDWYSEYLDWAIPAFRLVHSGVAADTQIHTHMCYSEFTDIIPAIDSMDADVITFEASRSDLLILDALKENNFKTEVGPGVYDIHSPRVPSVEEICNALTKIRAKTSDDKLWVNPDCGLKTRGIAETEASLRNLVEAARIIRG